TATHVEKRLGDTLVGNGQYTRYRRARGRLAAALLYPPRTILSEHTLVRINRNISRREADLVDAFARFLFGEEAQRIFVRYGFRSVTESLNEANPAFGRIEDPFRIGDLGGWKRAKTEIVDSVWKR